MRRFFGPMGSVSRVTIESQALKSNMLGDPSVRVVDVYVPAGHDDKDCRCLSTLSVSQEAARRTPTGTTSARIAGTARPADREERMAPVVVAFPDCFTRLGGNQYINCASMGAWEDFLLHEMLPAIEQRFGAAAPAGGASSAKALAAMARSCTR